MLLQTNSYVVPKDRRPEHARLLRRFRQTLARLGCEHFEVYEQVGSNWSSAEPTGRYVQLMRFRDRRHQLAVQAAERNDPVAQALIAEFCELINFPYQQQQGLFAVGFYSSVLPVAPARGQEAEQPHEEPGMAEHAEAPMMPEAPATYQPVSFQAEREPAEELPQQEEPAPAYEAHEPAEHHVEHAAPELPALPHEEQEPHEPAIESHVSDPHDSEARDEEPVHAASDEGANGHWHSEPTEGNGQDVAPPHEPEFHNAGEAQGRSFDDVLAEHFAPDQEPVVSTHSSGSGIGEVLDAGLAGEDDLDVPLPAELIDEPESLTAHPAEHEQHGEHRH